MEKLIQIYVFTDMTRCSQDTSKKMHHQTTHTSVHVHMQYSQEPEFGACAIINLLPLNSKSIPYCLLCRNKDGPFIYLIFAEDVCFKFYQLERSFSQYPTLWWFCSQMPSRRHLLVTGCSYQTLDFEQVSNSIATSLLSSKTWPHPLQHSLDFSPEELNALSLRLTACDFSLHLPFFFFF